MHWRVWMILRGDGKQCSSIESSKNNQEIPLAHLICWLIIRFPYYWVRIIPSTPGILNGPHFPLDHSVSVSATPSASMVGRTITRAKQAAKTSKPKTVRKSSPMRLEPRVQAWAMYPKLFITRLMQKMTHTCSNMLKHV